MERTLLIGGVIHFQEARACASVGGVRRAAREPRHLQQGRAPRSAGAVARHIKLAGLCPFRAVHILAVTLDGEGYPNKYPVLLAVLLSACLPFLAAIRYSNYCKQEFLYEKFFPAISSNLLAFQLHCLLECHGKGWIDVPDLLSVLFITLHIFTTLPLWGLDFSGGATPDISSCRYVSAALIYILLWQN